VEEAQKVQPYIESFGSLVQSKLFGLFVSLGREFGPMTVTITPSALGGTSSLLTLSSMITPGIPSQMALLKNHFAP